MPDRHPRRINRRYLNRVLDALSHLSIDTRTLPLEFARASWEDRARYIREHFPVDFCCRCKLPKRPEDMDTIFAVCLDCARALHVRPLNSRSTPKPTSVEIAEELQTPPRDFPDVTPMDMRKFLAKLRSTESD
jgi:hypothetical protein